MQAESAVCLASASLIRRHLLAQAGVTFNAVAVSLDEEAVRDWARSRSASADETALMLAELKARQIADKELLVLGADQILNCDGIWMGKPADRQAASAQLRALRGRDHVLHTAVVAVQGGRVLWRHIARPRLRMRRCSDAFLETYLDHEPRYSTSCGAYCIEGLGVQLFDQIEGDHSAILGLPLLPVLRFLRRHGMLAS